MADYDFHQLSPPDLEILTRDLLQAHWGITLESFKTGKDAGIDLRYATTQDKIIVQCKHYIRTSRAGLLRDLRKEADKVKRLQPTRYVLVTSVPLSQADKTAIIEIIGSKVLLPGDVIGREGLNNLLGQHPEIEGKHFKLWLASRAVLDRVLHNAAVTRSEFKVRRVYQAARLYVQSEAYPRALKMLGDERVVILAGPPGVGKTTLADLLLYEHLEKGYRAVLIQRDIEEGQSLFQEGERQVFYFDDFMGATFLGDRASAFTGNDDRVLLEFIAHVRATPTARLILATREHIYAQAMGKSERLRNSELDDLRVFLRMPDYSFAQKARILYNHLYFSDLPAEYQDELLRDDFYLKIIKHEKFNPRIIEWLSSYRRRIRKTPVKQYLRFVGGLLRDPSEIWRHAYEQEISEAGRTMLLTLFSFGGKAAGILLKPGFVALHGERARQYGFPTRPEDFRFALREVAGAFIKPWGTHGVEVIDPSVLDLLNMVVREMPENAADVIAGAVTFDQIERIWSFAKAANGGPVTTCIIQQGDRLVTPVGQRMLDRRKIDLGKGNVAYRGVTFESRLAIVIDMADRMPSSRFRDLIEPLFDRLFEEWRSERPEINDAVNLLRVIDGTRSMTNDAAAKRKAVIRSALLEEINRGHCRSDELREVISILDPSDALDHSMITAARTAFDVYRRSHFAEDLRECRSLDQFDGLIEDLELFKEELGVNVDRLLEQVQEEKDEFEAHEDARADHMQDEWKERWRDERDSDRSVSDMFGSLRDDRD
jgi:hypothetical protein